MAFMAKELPDCSIKNVAKGTYKELDFHDNNRLAIMHKEIRENLIHAFHNDKSIDCSNAVILLKGRYIRYVSII